ncbi:cytochrome P450 [Haliangium ochraceum DSM 14365]|uniref:Cytochrome P450 n=2 Tax=Haliangium ochraceum TaxID=80816 RepID=D0LTG6_HALO1|nr:cytochrome P450 [Haliangium ochraceum DSM 14365]
MLNDPLKLMTRAFEQHGRISYLPGINSYMISDPEFMRLILLDGENKFIKSPEVMSKIQVAVGNGLSTLNGGEWKRQRRMSNSAFKPRNIAAFEPIFHEHLGEVMHQWEQRLGQRFDIAQEMKRLTLRIVLKGLLSLDVTDRADMLIEHLDVLQDYAVYILWSLFPLPENVPTRRNRQYAESKRVMDEEIYRIIEQRRRDGEAAGKGDLLATYMHAVDDAGSGMGNTQLRHELMNLFLGGHDTTANSIAFTLYLLSRNPGCRERLERELDEVLGGRLPTVEDIPKLHYLECVYNESLRLYPPSSAMSRRTLEPIEYEGYEIPAGADLLLSQWAMHRDPTLWENPDVFDPDRFTPERSANRHKFAFVPFGAGPRICIGAKLARMEASMILAALLQKYRFESPPGYKLKLQSRLFVNAVPGVFLRLQKREVSEKM